ncbi:hypothetical protein [Sediminicoccus sp. KRV36]|uniref:hypothetical protein n=1 Tax=Sediminicoccus sp. KRV36 TaxID=3133721 RepID=UPI00200F5C97|nr:hypothetical protein [Sediminicoccus rosea]UPY36822.1 hypothetical protein LHU95_21820 [Sediminicoccus rosea]
MRIGIDFDNTIANYDGVFLRAAIERDLLPPDFSATSKNSVRDHLNSTGRKDAFTELQGYVYGARMDLVSPYPGVAAFCTAAAAVGHDLFVVSHKTRRPMLGPPHDMHAAARGFLTAQALTIPPEQVFFAERKEEKIARAASLALDAFIDDLPEILAMPGLPAMTRKILFDPDGVWAAQPYERHTSWASIHAALLGA